MICPFWSATMPPPACCGSSAEASWRVVFGFKSRGFRPSGFGPFVAAAFFPSSSTFPNVVNRARPSGPIAVAQTKASHDHCWKLQSTAQRLFVSLVGNGGAGYFVYWTRPSAQPTPRGQVGKGEPVHAGLGVGVGHGVAGAGLDCAKPAFAVISKTDATRTRRFGFMGVRGAGLRMEVR